MSKSIILVPLTNGKYTTLDLELGYVVDGLKLFYFGKYAIYHPARNKGISATICLHRKLWEVVNGSIPKGMVVDHINGDCLDNRLENLRVVTQRRNSHNRSDRRNNTTSSQYVGVYKHVHNKKWTSQILIAGKIVNLGYYNTELEASEAYQTKLAMLESEVS